MTLEMNPSVIILILTGAVCTLAQIPHEAIYFFGCFESGETEAEVQSDGDEIVYTDFKRQEEVWKVTKFTEYSPTYWPGFYLLTVINRGLCRYYLEWSIENELSLPLVKDAPESTIYPRDDVEVGVDNTLICFVNYFYPPSIRVNWTKNDMVVTEGASLSRYYPNNDGTFYQFSTLSFTPQEGDIYSCTVEHTALEEPKTRIWESEVSGPSVGPSVFCGVGLTLGLMGVATGTFLLIKANQCK